MRKSLREVAPSGKQQMSPYENEWASTVGFLLAVGERFLSADERDFLDDCDSILGEGGTLSFHQSKWLRSIRKRVENRVG